MGHFLEDDYPVLAGLFFNIEGEPAGRLLAAAFCLARSSCRCDKIVISPIEELVASENVNTDVITLSKCVNCNASDMLRMFDQKGVIDVEALLDYSTYAHKHYSCWCGLVEINVCTSCRLKQLLEICNRKKK